METKKIFDNIEAVYNDLDLLKLDLQGWHGNSKVFHNLIDSVDPSLIIEVGSWKGQSTVNMGKYLKSKDKKCKIYCIDTWLGSLEFLENETDKSMDLMQKNGYPQLYYQFLSNIVHNGLEDIVLPFPNTSLIVYRFFQKNNIKADLIYIDGSHDTFDVYWDLKNYINLLNSRGIIFGDDWGTWESVRKAIKQYTKEENIKFEVLENNFWVIKK